MTTNGRWIFPILVAFAAAVVGVFLGRAIFPPTPEAGTDLHALLHDELALDAKQHAQLEVLERRFAVRRSALELEIRADNARLADAIESEHGNGPQVAAAVEASHQAMGELQKETLAHVFSMRSLLHPTQASKFDRAVVRALTDERR